MLLNYVQHNALLIFQVISLELSYRNAAVVINLKYLNLRQIVEENECSVND